ncbi:hypothetical protein KAW64_15955, partial [bacterium]|nr:hypothetical protein [bacterium]
QVTSVAVRDLDKDGIQDLVCACENGAVCIMSGTGSGLPGEDPWSNVSRPVLLQNLPNPFNPVTTISFAVPSDAVEAELSIYSLTGAVIRKWTWRSPGPGLRQVTWDSRDRRGRRVASGVYFCRLRVDGWVGSMKMVALK